MTEPHIHVQHLPRANGTSNLARKKSSRRHINVSFALCFVRHYRIQQTAVHVYALLRREIPDQNQGSVHILPRYQSQLIFIELKYILKPFADLEGGYGGCNPPFQISKINKANKNRRQSSWKRKREKELHVCLVFMCTRVEMCINKHFSFKIFLLNPPPFEKFLDPRL